MITMALPIDEQDQMALGQGSKTVSATKSKGGGCFGFIFGGIFLVVGLGLSIYAFTSWRDTADIESWPTTEGIIESGTVTSSSDDDGTDYTPNVTFSYNVNNQRYTSSKITYWDTSYSSYSDAQAVVDKYPTRTEVRVYYDPDKPSRAVLDPQRQQTQMLIMMGVGGLFALVGLGVGVFSVRRSG